MPISEERYKVVCSRIDELSKRAGESFNRFVQLALATIGGFFWLRIEGDPDQLAPFLGLAPFILPVLGAVTAVEILFYMRSWHGYRKAEAALVGDPSIAPKLFGSGTVEWMRVVVSLFAGGAGYLLLALPGK